MENKGMTEKATSRTRAILRLAGVIALAAVGLMAVVVGVCWVAGWRTASQISNGLSLTGAIAIVVGLLSTLGGWGLARDPEYMYAQSVSQQSLSEHARQGLRDSLRGYNLAIIAAGAGILCIAASTLIGAFT